MTARYDPLFGALTDDATWFPSPAHVFRRAALLDMMRGLPPGRLLDMGCGAGRLLVDWDRLGHAGEGAEIDPAARALARDCVEAFGADFRIIEAPKAEQAGTYDYLTVIEVLEHLEDPRGALESWSRSLRDGGVLVASVPAFQRLWGASDAWAGHVQRFEPADFRGLVEACGFEILESRLYGFPIGNLARIAGNLTSARKMRARADGDLDRQGATLASGRDRSAEAGLRAWLRSPPVTAGLRTGIAVQRLFRKRRGIGIAVMARLSRPA